MFLFAKKTLLYAIQKLLCNIRLTIGILVRRGKRIKGRWGDESTHYVHLRDKNFGTNSILDAAPKAKCVNLLR